MNYKTLSADELIHALEQAGLTPDLDLIRACLERMDEIEPQLLELLRTDTWKLYGPENDTDPRVYADMHAGFLLLAVRSQTALPVFDQVFRDPERDFLLEWVESEMHHYGALALPFLAKLLLDEEAPEASRASVSSILTRIVYSEPQHKPFVIATLQKLLPPLPAGDEPIVDPSEFNQMRTWAVLELSRLGDWESQAQIKALYAANAIDAGSIGDYADYMQRLQSNQIDLPTPYDIIWTYQALRRRAEEEAREKVSWEKGAKQREADRIKLLAKRQRDARERQAVNRFSPTHAPAEAGKPFTRQQPKIGRNAPCPCGSGKKYKKCCGRKGRR